MPLFAWEARTSADEIRSGELAAADETRVIEALRRRGLRVTRVDLRARRAIPRTAADAPPAALLAALRRFLTLRTAGVGAAEALDLSARDSAGTIARGLHAAQLAVESGAPLGEALAQHPTIFGALGARALAAADARGLLDATLAALVELLARTVATQAEVRRAAARSLAAAAVLLATAALGTAIVAPAAATLYLRTGVAPVGLSARFLAAAPWLALGTAVGAGLLALACAALALSSRLRARVVELVSGLAAARGRLALARFARALAVLATAEVPRQAALELAGWESGDRALVDAAQRARAGLAEGDDLGRALAGAGFPTEFARAVAAAGRTGDLPATLRRLAELAEDEALTWLSSRTGRLVQVLYALAIALAVTGALVLAAPLVRT